jgi:type I restriction-modification system DNA methylase subunit
MKKTTSNIVIDTNFQTPIPVCEYMVKMIPAYAKKILEPTPGIGNIVSVLKCNYDNVIAANDFFLINKNERFDCIVMNPPFSSKYAFMNNAPPPF